MKTHIYIATTQGLVAIQHITPIDDPDINSIVSVNGTSTTANISNSYHNFVKKGVGIIQQLFGACSYRVDISARIDQGNSWQVAMYLAHLAQSKGLLGNGQVSQGDTVICATGVVNTTNLEVMAVNEVGLKFKLAEPQLKQWSELGAKVKFLLPQANHLDITKQQAVLLVSNLQQAALVLPNQAPKPTQKQLKFKEFVSVHFIQIALILGGVLACVIFIGGINWFSQNSNTGHSLTQDKSGDNQPAIASTQLVAMLQQDKNCIQTQPQNLVVNQQTFAAIGLSQLCELYLQTAQPQGQILLIAQDAYTVLPLIQGTQGWEIPLPKNRLSDRSYFLVTLKQTLSEEKVEQLRLYREAMAKPKLLTESTLQQWLLSQAVEFEIYSHRLLLK